MKKKFIFSIVYSCFQVYMTLCLLEIAARRGEWNLGSAGCFLRESFLPRKLLFVKSKIIYGDKGEEEEF